MRSLLLEEIKNFISCLRLTFDLLGDVVAIRFFLRAIINKVTLSDVLGEELLKSTEVFFAEVVPEIPVFWRNEIVIDQR